MKKIILIFMIMLSVNVCALHNGDFELGITLWNVSIIGDESTGNITSSFGNPNGNYGFFFNADSYGTGENDIVSINQSMCISSQTYISFLRNLSLQYSESGTASFSVYINETLIYHDTNKSGYNRYIVNTSNYSASINGEWVNLTILCSTTVSGAGHNGNCYGMIDDITVYTDNSSYCDTVLNDNVSLNCTIVTNEYNVTSDCSNDINCDFYTYETTDLILYDAVNNISYDYENVNGLYTNQSIINIFNIDLNSTPYYIWLSGYQSETLNSFFNFSCIGINETTTTTETTTTITTTISTTTSSTIKIDNSSAIIDEYIVGNYNMSYNNTNVSNQLNVTSIDLSVLGISFLSLFSVLFLLSLISSFRTKKK